IHTLWLFSLLLRRSTVSHPCPFFFLCNATAPTETYTLSLHDALPIWSAGRPARGDGLGHCDVVWGHPRAGWQTHDRRCSPLLCRSEEHTSELQSHLNLVCRLLLEKKK